MIAISSHKPFSHSAEIASNQTHAFRSWLDVFDSIIYFGAPEPPLVSAKTEFISSPEPPTIRSLMLLGALAKEPACIINADILLAPNAFEMLSGAMKKFQAAISFRYEFDPVKRDLSRAKRVDNGLDVFIAQPSLWRRCWSVCPDKFRIGKPVWDSWLFMWLFNNCKGKFTDLSTWRFVYHPKHSR